MLWKIMNYEWDEQKRTLNFSKHGVDFVEAMNFGKVNT